MTTIRADGIDRQTSREGCDGWERTSFSDDGHRVYLRAEFVCEGDVVFLDHTEVWTFKTGEKATKT